MNRAIALQFTPATEELFGRSKWWGAPDLPSEWEYPCTAAGDPLHFICQLRCEELAPYDPQGLLPHEGMLYLFATLGAYIDLLDIAEQHTGLGEWPSDCFKVLYAPSLEGLTPYPITYEDGEAAYLAAEEIHFAAVAADYDSFKLLGRPYYAEIAELYSEHLVLLQIDEQERWGLRLYDCGMLCFLITPEALRCRDWASVRLYFHSF